MSADLEGEIESQLRVLPREEQRRVLEFARALVLSKSQAIPGKELLRFAGTIPIEQLQQINAAIEVGCERVDLNEW